MSNLLNRSPYERMGVSSLDIVAQLAGDIWGRNLGTQPRDSAIYLEHYNAKVDALDPGRVLPSTHCDVIAIVTFVKDGKNRKLSQLREDLKALTPVPSWLRSVDELATRQAIDFGASLWAFLDVSCWQEDESLNDFARRTFSPAMTRQPIPHDEDLLHLNAQALCHIGGFELVWTSNLSDHLRLDLTDPKHPQLLLFRHASYLAGDRGQPVVFPDGLLRETAETIALLFPFAESPRRRWNRRVRKKADVDVEPGISCNTPRNLDHYHFWRERLALLQQTFDRSKPDSLSQWLHDKRDSDKFYTFWFAVVAIVLTLFFGLTQSITGIIQAVKS